MSRFTREIGVIGAWGAAASAFALPPPPAPRPPRLAEASRRAGHRNYTAERNREREGATARFGGIDKRERATTGTGTGIKKTFAKAGSGLESAIPSMRATFPKPRRFERCKIETTVDALHCGVRLPAEVDTKLARITPLPGYVSRSYPDCNASTASCDSIRPDLCIRARTAYAFTDHSSFYRISTSPSERRTNPTNEKSPFPFLAPPPSTPLLSSPTTCTGIYWIWG